MGRALRVETTVNNAGDFGLHTTLTADNWRALRRLDAATNALFLAAIDEGTGACPMPRHWSRSFSPASTMASGHPACASVSPGSWPCWPRSPPSPTSWAGSPTSPCGRRWRRCGTPGYTSAQASYDLRRLRLKGFIERVRGSQTYRVTSHGLRIAVFFTQLAARVVVPALSDLAALAYPKPPLREP